MNQLNANPKKTMFYAAAQNMLQQQTSHKRLRFGFSPTYPDQSQSPSGRDQSINSLDSSKAYNIRGRFLLLNENPQKLEAHERQKQELKAYLQKQIEEKRKIKERSLELEKIEEQKAEQRYQLYPYKKNESPQPNQIQTTKISQYVSNAKPYESVVYRNNSQENNKLLQKLAIIQNDIQLMQTAKNMEETNLGDVRNKIKAMMKQKQPSTQKPLEFTSKPLEEHKPRQQFEKDRLLECETIFIPAHQILEIISLDKSQTLERSNKHQSVHEQNTSQLLQHSALTISQMTGREKSRESGSQQMKILSRKSSQVLKTEKQSVTIKEEPKKAKTVKLKQPERVHRTALLMQIPATKKDYQQKQE